MPVFIVRNSYTQFNVFFTWLGAECRDYDSRRYKINKLAIINAKTWTLFLQILENFPRCLTKLNLKIR